MNHKIVKVKAGEVNSNSLGPVLGPLGLPTKKIVDEINQMTMKFKGRRMLITIALGENRTYEIIIGKQPASQLILEKINKLKGSGNNKVNKIGTIEFSALEEIAKSISTYSINKDHHMKELIGTAKSLGVDVINE